MNTIGSVGYGWLALIVAGTGAFYFAKRSIDADRSSKFESLREKNNRFVYSREYKAPRRGHQISKPKAEAKSTEELEQNDCP
ncbi:hypothetical protein CLAIMM_09794 [Cladophialophora immunda]|nr:hypothetical protein CLAIMM_09794 [Cladophialophora immunda]